VRVTAGAIAVELTAGEAASAHVCLLAGAYTRSSADRILGGRSGGATRCRSMPVVQARRTTLWLARPAGSSTVAVRLEAVANPVRATIAVRPVR
jgi:hypothetical protein